MILVYQPTGLDPLPLQNVPWNVELLSDARNFVLRSPSAALGVLDARASPEAVIPILGQGRVEAPSCPMVIVVQLTPGNVRRLATQLNDPLLDVVWDQEVDFRLVEAVERLMALRLGSRVYHDIVRRTRLSPFITTVVRRTLCDAAPVSSVRSLAARLGVPESTLRYHWKHVIPSATLSTFVSWSILIRSVEPGSPSDRAAAARRVGVHPRTLDRIAVRLAANTWAELAQSPHVIVARYRSWIDSVLPSQRAVAG